MRACSASAPTHAEHSCLLNPLPPKLCFAFSSCRPGRLITPYDVSLILHEASVDFLFVFNQIVSCIFIIDMIFQFFLPYPEKGSRSGGLVKDHRRITLNYLRGWFTIDLLSVLPFDVVTIMGGFGDSSKVSVTRVVRLIRLLRLLKLARLLRASRIFARWRNHISLKQATLTLMFWAQVSPPATEDPFWDQSCVATGAQTTSCGVRSLPSRCTGLRARGRCSPS